jgi:HK97 family phage portal protein
MANTNPGLFQIIRNSLWNPSHDRRSNNYDHHYQPDFLQYSESGEYVTESKGSRISTVFNCVNLIAQDIAQTPFNVYKDTDQGRAGQPQSPVNRLIDHKPNEYMTSYAWTYSMVYSYLIYGNAYSYILRDGNYQPIALLPLHPSAVQLQVVEGKVIATIDGMGAVAYDDILHYKLYTHDGLNGVSPIIHNAEVIGKRLKEQKYSSRTLGAKPPGYLSADVATETQKDNVASQWKAAIHGDEVHGTPFLVGGVKYNPLSLSADQVQFIESTIRTNIEIYGMFRVQPTMVSNFDEGVKANAEQQAINHVKFTLMPHFTMIEDEVNTKLFSENNKMNRVNPFYSWHNSDRFLRGDMETRYKVYHDMILDGVLNADEVRAKENLPKQPDGLGEKYYMQGAMIEKGKEAEDVDS